MRIIGGSLKGKNFNVSSGTVVRPTGGRVKKSMFDILGKAVEVDLVADLFAGSGSLGFEALSRGAGKCLFVENNEEVVKVLFKNIGMLSLSERSFILRLDLIRKNKRLLKFGPVELLFGDPPYEKGFVKCLVEFVAESSFLVSGGCFILEHSFREIPPDVYGLKLVDRRNYGETRVSFFKRVYY